MQTYLNSREIFDFRHFLQLTSEKNQTDVFPQARRLVEIWTNVL